MTSISGKFSLHDLEQVEAAEARQPHVGDHHVDVFAIHQRQPGLGRRGAHDAVVAAKGLGETFARVVVRVDHEHGLAALCHAIGV